LLRDSHPNGELIWEGLGVKTSEDSDAYWMYLTWRYSFQEAYGISLCQSPCQDCADTLDIIGHHTDYSLPSRLVWLCRPCHLHRHWHIVHGGEELVHSNGRSEASLTDEEKEVREYTDTLPRPLKATPESSERLIWVK